MTEATLYYSYDSFEKVIETLLRLPKPLRPIQFGHDEGVKKSKDLVSDKKRFRTFIEKALSGFFLHSEAVIYGFYINALKEFEIYIENIDAMYALILMQELAGHGVRFAYAADNAERNHRNRLIKKTSYGVDEAWVGRDWHIYVPGLYWLTVIPEALARQHDVPLNVLKRAALTVEEPAPDICLLKFFESPEQWLAYSGQLDRLCEETPGLFAISRIKAAFDEAKTFQETGQVLHAWR